jgi:hypothetical protein
MTQSEAPCRAPAPPSLQDCICLLYEHSLVPVREIARLAGLTERNVYATVRRCGCRPRVHVGAGGGRRIVVPANEALPETLDVAAVQLAIAACAAARQRSFDAATERTAARSAKVARRQSIREAETEARTLSTIAGALRNLAIADRGGQARPAEKKKRRPYKFKPMLVTPLPPRTPAAVAAAPVLPAPAPAPARWPWGEPACEEDRRIDEIAAQYYDEHGRAIWTK